MAPVAFGEGANMHGQDGPWQPRGMNHGPEEITTWAAAALTAIDRLFSIGERLARALRSMIRRGDWASGD